MSLPILHFPILCLNSAMLAASFFLHSRMYFVWHTRHQPWPGVVLEILQRGQSLMRRPDCFMWNDLQFLFVVHTRECFTL